MRVIDLEFGDRATGVTVSAHADGISIDGWYDVSGELSAGESC